MGSSQSSPSNPSTTADHKSTPSDKSADDSTTISYHRSKTNKNKNLSGMALVNYRCRKKKRAYDRCVGDWYSREFMTGQSMHQADVCEDRFQAYRECMLKGIKKEIWDKQGLPPPKEGSPLAEIDDDEST